MAITKTADGAELHWQLRGEVTLPPLVLLHAIGTTASLWDPVLPHLHARFRTLQIDARGHGGSTAPSGEYDLALLADDVARVMTDAGIGKSPIAGISLGGMTAMQLALDHPDRVTALALVCTSAHMDRAVWEARIEAVRSGGTAAIADAAIGRFLSAGFATAHPDVASALHETLVRQADAGYIGVAAAIRDMALAGRLGDLRVPALVITGTEDVSTPYAGHGDRLLAGIAEAVHMSLASGHLAAPEVPAELARALLRFLGGPSQTLYESGLANRRRVLGDAWVDRSLTKRTPFNSDFQEMITRIAWHEVWGRPGLDERTRRLIVVVITASLGRWEEFDLHVRAGLTRGGFTRDELKEALMQTAIYAGVPAANTAFSRCGDILSSLEAP